MPVSVTVFAQADKIVEVQRNARVVDVVRCEFGYVMNFNRRHDETFAHAVLT